MLLTEEEAKAKRCCGPTCFCIASECMAWQWTDGEYEFNSQGGDGWEFSHTSGLSGSGKWKRRNHHRRGYCGLAGKSDQ
jgi:hypothetical protein